MTYVFEQTRQALIANLDKLAQTAVDRQVARRPELWKPYLPAGYSKSLRDAAYHFSFLAESAGANAPALFIDYVAWAKVLFAGLHLPPETLADSLACMKAALEETLAPEMAQLTISILDAALEHLPSMPDAPQSFLSPTAPLYDLTREYLNTLLYSDRHQAIQLILDASGRGIAVKDIYLHVFQPCQQEIGRLWQMNRISVAQEHYCTATTQLVMAQLYPQIFSSQKKGHKLVATSVSGELHEIGMRMVADLLEMEGWDTYYLGASTPTEGVLRMLEEQQADVLAISATLTPHVSKVVDLIEKVRSTASLSTIKILVGGYPFNITPELWRQVGADGYGRNAEEAVRAANQLVE